MRNESDWAYLPLCEERVVAKLIKERSHLDTSYQARKEGLSFVETCGGFGIAEAVLCTYVDLDRLIESCGFTPEQNM